MKNGITVVEDNGLGVTTLSQLMQMLVEDEGPWETAAALTLAVARRAQFLQRHGDRRAARHLLTLAHEMREALTRSEPPQRANPK